MTTHHVTPEEYNRIAKELERAQELRKADTSRMNLAEKIQHQRAVKQAMDRARGN